MTDDCTLRWEIKKTLDKARRQILNYNGLYSDEDLIRDVLHACRTVSAGSHPHMRLEETWREVEMRCVQLIAVVDRFAARDFSAILSSRARAIAAIDLFQDAVFHARRLSAHARSNGALLRGRAS